MAKRVEQHIFKSEEIQERAASFIADRLKEKLSEQDVLLFLSGGGAIGMYRVMFEKLKGKSLVHKLTVTLLDERFVEPNSIDSNEQQLREAGIRDWVENMGGEWIGYLEASLDGKTTARNISQRLEEKLKKNPFVLVLAGIGSDGHTAGILPTRDEKTMERVFGSTNLIEYYELPADTNNPHRKRITATSELIARTDQVVVYAVGDEKREVLSEFVNRGKSVEEFPALLLHKSKFPVVILTDQSLDTSWGKF